MMFKSRFKDFIICFKYKDLGTSVLVAVKDTSC